MSAQVNATTTIAENAMRADTHRACRVEKDRTLRSISSHSAAWAGGLAAVGFLVMTCTAFAADDAPAEAKPPEPKPIWQVLVGDSVVTDSRSAPLRELRQPYHPWTPPSDLEVWQAEATRIRTQVQVAAGLWPMFPKKLLQPVIHGAVQRDGYTVERVYFETLPGHYVTGNLYRPQGFAGPRPGVLCPHGHWANGRFYVANTEKVTEDLKSGAESIQAAAESPLQARMVGLVRMGCVVFHYDMIGYADSQGVSHRDGFTTATAGLWLQNPLGVQTFNSIRALDFLLSLTGIDADRIAVTGASGGGTQTFMLCALDDRVNAAFPAVMVSTGMQGGCVCENADYLRLGINNIAIAALFAPKPMAMSGADDWTVAIETRGLPELKQIYGLYGESENVEAKAYPQFPHNYNSVAREMMYRWLKQHLHLPADTPVTERPFTPLTVAEMTVFDESHPMPKDFAGVDELRSEMTKIEIDQFKDLLRNLEQPDGWAKYRDVVEPAAMVLLGEREPALDVQSKDEFVPQGASVVLKGLAESKQRGTRVPYLAIMPFAADGSVVVWIDGAGKSHLFESNGRPRPEIRKLIGRGMTVVSVDVLGTGETTPGGQPLQVQRVVKNDSYSGYTFGYNRPLFAQRVRDILETVAATFRRDGVQSVHLVGTNGAGPWVLLANATRGDLPIGRLIVDVEGFGFSGITSIDDPNYLPGALKYGGLGGLAAISLPDRATVAGWKGVPAWEQAALRRLAVVQPRRLELISESLTRDEIAERLLGR